MKRIIFTAVLFFLIGQEWREYERKKLLNELKIKSGLPICFMDLCDQARGHNFDFCPSCANRLANKRKIRQGWHTVKRRTGRPAEYIELIESLEDETVYTPAGIAIKAIKDGFVSTETESERRLARQRIRINFGRFSNLHKFPDRGDDMVKIKGQAPTPGWYGWRWKRAYLR